MARLGCAPVINLFEQTAEPIDVTQRRYEYRIVPDVGRALGTEVYSVDAVVSIDPNTSSRGMPCASTGCRSPSTTR